MRLGYAILTGSKILIGSVLLMLVINPANYVSLQQRAILNEYLNVYCLQPEKARQDPDGYNAMAAQMSRLTIKAGLGKIALAEYYRCKVIN